MSVVWMIIALAVPRIVAYLSVNSRKCFHARHILLWGTLIPVHGLPQWPTAPYCHLFSVELDTSRTTLYCLHVATTPLIDIPQPQIYLSDMFERKTKPSTSGPISTAPILRNVASVRPRVIYIFTWSLARDTLRNQRLLGSPILVYRLPRTFRQCLLRAKCFCYPFTVIELSQLFSCQTPNDVFHPPCLCNPGYSCACEQPSLTLALVRSDRSSYVPDSIADPARQRNRSSVFVPLLVHYHSTGSGTGASSDYTANTGSGGFVTLCSLPSDPVTPATSFNSLQSLFCVFHAAPPTQRLHTAVLFKVAPPSPYSVPMPIPFHTRHVDGHFETLHNHCFLDKILSTHNFASVSFHTTFRINPSYTLPGRSTCFSCPLLLLSPA